MPDIIGWLNKPIPGDPNPTITRMIIVLFVMAVAFRWTQNMVNRWTSYARETKRTTQWLTVVLIANGFGLVAAAQRDDPVRVATAVLGVSFAGLATSMYVRFRNDGSTDPVYPYLYPSSIFSRLHR